MKPRKTKPMLTNKSNKIKTFDYFRGRNDEDLISIKDKNNADFVKPFTDNNSILNKFSYFPV